MAHIVLFVDSVFDNKAYVGTESDVIKQLREIIPQNRQTTLKTVEGSEFGGGGF